MKGFPHRVWLSRQGFLRCPISTTWIMIVVRSEVRDGVPVELPSGQRIVWENFYQCFYVVSRGQHRNALSGCPRGRRRSERVHSDDLRQNSFCSSPERSSIIQTTTQLRRDEKDVFIKRSFRLK